MRNPFALPIVLALGLPWTTSASAQDGPAAGTRARAAASRAVAACVHREDEQLQRLLRALEQAEARAAAEGAGPDVREQAEAAIDALLERIDERALAVRACVPSGADATATPRSIKDEPGSLSNEHNTMHTVERGTRLEGGVVVVQGERVDGEGTARDEDVRAAVRALSPRLARCGAQLRGRGARAGAEVHVVIRADSPTRAETEVEHTTGGDEPLRDCVGEAMAGLVVIRSQRGHSEYAYVFRFDGP